MSVIDEWRANLPATPSPLGLPIERVIALELRVHQRAAIPARDEPERCMCGWRSSGYGDELALHQAGFIRQSLTTSRRLDPETESPDRRAEMMAHRPPCAMTADELAEGIASGRLVQGVTSRRITGVDPIPRAGEVIEPCRALRVHPAAGRHLVGILVTEVSPVTAGGWWDAKGLGIARAQGVADEVVGDGPGLDAHGGAG